MTGVGSYESLKSGIVTCEQDAGGESGKGCKNSSGKRITGMADPGSHKVDTHSVKNGFGTGHGQ